MTDDTALSAELHRRRANDLGIDPPALDAATVERPLRTYRKSAEVPPADAEVGKVLAAAAEPAGRDDVAGFLAALAAFRAAYLPISHRMAQRPLAPACAYWPRSSQRRRLPSCSSAGRP